MRVALSSGQPMVCDVLATSSSLTAAKRASTIGGSDSFSFMFNRWWGWACARALKSPREENLPPTPQKGGSKREKKRKIPPTNLLTMSIRPRPSSLQCSSGVHRVWVVCYVSHLLLLLLVSCECWTFDPSQLNTPSYYKWWPAHSIQAKCFDCVRV